MRHDVSYHIAVLLKKYITIATVHIYCQTLLFFTVDGVDCGVPTEVIAYDSLSYKELISYGKGWVGQILFNSLCNQRLGVGKLLKRKRRRIRPICVGK